MHKKHKRSFLSAKKMVFVSVALFFLFAGAACSSSENTKQQERDGGVFKSTDRGITWEQKVYVRDLPDGRKERIDNENISFLYEDPQDPDTVYAVGPTGVWLTVNGAEQWRRISNHRVTAFAMDPKQQGTLYLGSFQSILKSTDAGKNWPEVYRETRANVRITTLAVNPVQTRKIWAGTSDGEILLSQDRGLSWKVVHDFDVEVKQVIIDPLAPSVMYVGTAKDGIFRTMNEGKDWENLFERYGIVIKGTDKRGKPKREVRKGSEIFVTLRIDPTSHRRLYYVSNYGILRSSDRGDTWEELKLVTEPGTIPIYDLAINARDGREIYYTTNRVIYYTRNFGNEWFTETVPTGRKITAIIINSHDPTTIYVGTEFLPPPKKKKRGLFF